MKKLILSSIVLSALGLAIMAFSIPSAKINGSGNPPQEKPDLGCPDEVAKILETSCYDCHTNAASNAKAKLKLNFSKWSELSDAKKVGKLGDICDEVKKGGMPPSKYVSNYPDHALNAEQKELVCKWADEESNKLMGE